jgi:hypothetical protein
MRDQMFISRTKDATNIDGANSFELQLIYDRFKVLISSMQITSALCITFDGVPWPRIFKDFSLALGVVNLDMSFLFGMTNCQLSLPFLDKFLMHSLMPIVLLGALGVIHGVSRLSCVKVHEETKRVWKAFAAKISITVTLLIYPGLCVRIFQVFKCKGIMSTDGDTELMRVLQQDFRVVCFGSEHQTYMFVAMACLFVYVFGTPIMVGTLLRRSQEQLYDTQHPKHESTKKTLGSLYAQYEGDFYMWEIAVMMKKMTLTGAMVVISPGSSVQILVGLLIAIAYMLCVLKLAPFVQDADDWLSFVTSLQLSLTMLFGLVLLMDTNDKKTYNVSLIGYILVAIHVATFVLFVALVSLVIPCCRKRVSSRSKCCCMGSHGGIGANNDTENTANNLTSVIPYTADPPPPPPRRAPPPPAGSKENDPLVCDDVSESGSESSDGEEKADLKAEFEKEAEKEVKKSGIGMITGFFE